MNRIATSGTQAGRGAAGMAAILAVILACSDTGPTGPHGAAAEVKPLMLINGVDDFGHRAAGAIMIYDPAFPDKPGWRSFCSAALIHERVVQTAGHCIQFLEAGLAAGVVKAAWISFQQDPEAHFTADPAVADPASGGWYEIESLHNNPDNPDWVALRQAAQEAETREDSAEIRANWGKFHDSGAIVLRKAVNAIRPMSMASRRGTVNGFLRSSGC